MASSQPNAESSLAASSSPRPSSRQRLFLIDGYSTIFRAFYAIRNLSSSKGEPTNAVYGFVQMLRKLLRDERPDLVGIALDVSRKTFRSERYAEYKANRAPMPDDLRVQLPYIRRAIEGFKIPILELEGYEADDVLGTIGRKAAEAGYEVILVTADKDLMQVVGDGLSLYHTGRDKLYDSALVEADFGVPPGQVADVLALMGDSVDNIPGVPGIGEKGAKSLIREHGSLDALLQNAGEVKRKSYREGLQNYRDQALLSRELATIHTDLQVTLDAEALRYEEPDGDQLFELYRELDFFSLLEELEAEGLMAAKRVYAPAYDCATASEWLQRTAEIGPRCCVSLVGEISGDENGDRGIIGLAVAAPGGNAVFADFRHKGLRDAAVGLVREWASDGDRTLIGHDLKEVLRFLLRNQGGDGIFRVKARLLDTMLQAYLLRSASRSFSLAEVAFERFHHRIMKLEEAGFERDGAPIAGLPGLLLLAAERALLPGELADSMAGPLSSPEAGDPASVYSDIEEPLIPVLVKIEERGITLDVDFLAEMSEELAGELDALEQEIYEMAGEEFNINSPQQLGSILFEKLGYPVLRRTRKKKSYSTSAEILEELAARGYDLPEKILEYREYNKLKSTYVDTLPELVDRQRRLHTHYHQAVAATGRLSSANPNLQNIPVRSRVGQRIRKAFRATEGYRLLVADYSQIELRVLAHVAREKALIAAFEAGADIHRSTAASIFGIDPSLITEEQRRAAKTINFGILYGMSAYGLAQRLGIAPKEAKAFIDSYFDRFPGVRDYAEDTLQQVERDGYVETLYGRCRFLPDIKSRNRNLRENAKRMAINARIQGTAADLLKLAMIAADRRLDEQCPGARLLLTVHDELVAEAPAADAERVAEMLREEMEGVAELVVPLKVDLGIGDTWYDAKS